MALSTLHFAQTIVSLQTIGENVEVLEPMELREEIKKRLEECLTRYK